MGTMGWETGSVSPDTGGAQDRLAPVAFASLDELINGFADQFAPLRAALANDRGTVVSLPAGQIDLGQIT